MLDFLCMLLVEVTISAGALFMYNAFPVHMILGRNKRDDPDIVKDTKYWVEASLYYFIVLLALSFPLKYIVTRQSCGAKK